jgi:Trk-type K+ transport system membrane component
MSVFDAIGHSYATVAIGGFSTHDASIGYFDSVAVESVATHIEKLVEAKPVVVAIETL